MNQLEQEVLEKRMPVSSLHVVESVHERTVKAAIYQMLHRIDDSTLSSKKLANQTFYSPYHFDRIFRSITGIPPRLYLSALRFQWSKKLLLKSTLSATEVGQTVGYSSFGTFSSKFSTFIGLSPQQFRNFIERKMLVLSELKDIRIPEENRSLLNIVIEGSIDAPKEFHGVICVGLFTKPIPMGKPVSCTMIFEPGKYAISNVPDGTYYIMSIAFSWDDPLDEYLHPENSLRGKASGKIVVTGGIAKGESNVTLRPPRFYDPPMLVSFPILVQTFLNKLEE